MPVSVFGGPCDDPLATASPQGIPDLRDIFARSKLPFPVWEANGDER
jgi:hypothetical protein